MPTTDSSRSERRAWFKAQELAAREGVARSTIWLWHKKGVAQKRQLGPRLGVRFRLVEEVESE